VPTSAQQAPTSPEQALRAVQVYCESRVPAVLRDEIRIECSRRGRSITIVERRPPWMPEYGPEWSSVRVAQLRLDDRAGAWALYWRDGRDRWHHYDTVEPTASVDPLLAEIEADPTGIFWG
jgi:Protein of unknown function (DUF3024)